MSGAKRTIEKAQSLELCARAFLIDNRYIEEALNGHLCTKVHSDNSEVYVKANEYYIEKNLHKTFSLTEFRDEIKRLLDLSEFIDAFEYDLKRID